MLALGQVFEAVLEPLLPSRPRRHDERGGRGVINVPGQRLADYFLFRLLGAANNNLKRDQTQQQKQQQQKRQSVKKKTGKEK